MIKEIQKPIGCHPKIADIPNWQKKVCLPCPRAARLRRKMLDRGIPLGTPVPFGLNDHNDDDDDRYPTSEWPEWKTILYWARSNMATPAASTYGLPIYNTASGFYVYNPERNEFWDDPMLLKFL